MGSGEESQEELLKDLVGFDTVTNPAEGLKPSAECTHFLQDWLRARGVQADLFQSEGYYGLRGQLGDVEPEVLLMAHLDVVPAGPREDWATEPYHLAVRGDKAFGRGAVDDKGNVVAICHAIRRLQSGGIDGIAFAFTGDEEIGGRHGARVVARDFTGSFVLNGDGQGLRIIARRRNAFGLRINLSAANRESKGRWMSKTFETETPGRGSRHSAYFVPGVDSHALLKASEFVLRTGTLVAHLEGSFVKDNVIPGKVTLDCLRPGRGTSVEIDDNLTALVGALLPLSRTQLVCRRSDFGVTALPNVYRRKGAEHQITMDIRAMADNGGAVLEAYRSRLVEVLPEAEMELEEGEGCLYTSPEAPLVLLAQEISRSLGLDPRTIEREGASDSRYFSSRGPQCIDFGPLGGNIHGPNEYVLLSSISRATDFYHQMGLRLRGTATAGAFT